MPQARPGDYEEISDAGYNIFSKLKEDSIK